MRHGGRLLRPLAADAGRGPGQLPAAYAEFGPLATAPAVRRARIAASWPARSFYGMSRWQGKLEHKQGFLGRIVDIGAELFAISAVCVRAEMLRRRPAAGRRVRAGRHVLPAGPLRVGALFDRLWDNTDDADAARAPGACDGRYTWLEEGVLDPSSDGPWIAATTPGPSATEDVASQDRLTARERSWRARQRPRYGPRLGARWVPVRRAGGEFRDVTFAGLGGGRHAQPAKSKAERSSSAAPV